METKSDSVPGTASLRFIGATLLAAILLPLLWTFGCRGLSTTPERPPQEPLDPKVEEMAESAELVLVGKVTGSASRWVGKKIFTTYDIEPLRVMKGSAPAERVQVVLLGGQVGVIAQHATHQARLQDEEISLLFLVQPRPGDSQGGLRVYSERGNVPLVLPGQAESRLQNNKRITSFLDSVQTHIEERR